jgi:hypothetical protein
VPDPDGQLICIGGRSGRPTGKNGQQEQEEQYQGGTEVKIASHDTMFYQPGCDIQ